MSAAPELAESADLESVPHAAPAKASTVKRAAAVAFDLIRTVFSLSI
jgi:hypothetical protein